VKVEDEMRYGTDRRSKVLPLLASCHSLSFNFEEETERVGKSGRGCDYTKGK